MVRTESVRQSPLAPPPARPRTKTEDVHEEDARATEPKPSYRSWKKKYRKMRAVFHQKMTECEQLHQQEQKALATVKRLAVENDRILDLLLDINNCQQIPLDKRIDLSLDPGQNSSSAGGGLFQSSAATDASKRAPSISLRQLLADVPHNTSPRTCDDAKTTALAPDLEPFEGDSYPLSFLSADDIDKYVHEIDIRIKSEGRPTLAPAAPSAAAVTPASRSKDTNGSSANASGTPAGASSAAAAVATPNGPGSATISAMARDFALKNPTSVYNWLRKHAPKTFLQDGEGEIPEGEAASKKSRAGRGDKTAKGASRGGGNRPSAAATGRPDKKPEEWDAGAPAEELDFATPAAARGKRKRADDDGGYRPKGGSGTRPSKKKRKTDGDGGTPTGNGRRIKKEKETVGRTKGA